MEIGLAESFDQGQTFKKIGLGGPVMSATPSEPCMVGDGFVRSEGNRLRMWYIFGQTWQKRNPEEQAERFYRIAQAESEDGIHWKRDGKYIIEAKSDGECQALPTVFTQGGLHHMHFCYRDAFDFRTNKDRSYRLGYAYSEDGRTWIRDDQKCGIDVTPGSWDSDMMCYPHVFECDGAHFLLYNGNEFGKNGFGAAILTG